MWLLSDCQTCASYQPCVLHIFCSNREATKPSHHDHLSIVGPSTNDDSSPPSHRQLYLTYIVKSRQQRLLRRQRNKGHRRPQFCIS